MDQHVPAQELLVLIASAQMPLINSHADISSCDTGLTFGPSLCLYPYIVFASKEGSGESAHMRRLARAFVA